MLNISFRLGRTEDNIFIPRENDYLTIQFIDSTIGCVDYNHKKVTFIFHDSF
jgi:hypothetical protein